MELIPANVSVLAAKLGSTPDVITKYLTDATAAADVKPFADTLGALEVFKPEELTQRIDNERAAAALKSKNETLGVTYGTMDRKILEETGIAKNSGESTIDYVTRAAKEKYGNKTSESDEITRLRTDIAAKDQLLQQKENKLQEMEVAHATERKQGTLNAKLDAAINALAINTTPELLDSQREFLKFRLMQAYEADVVDGKVVFKDKATGQEKRDQRLASPMTVEALVAEFAPKVVSLKKSSTVQPSGYNPGRNNSTDEAPAFDFSSYATKADFVKDMAAKGITSTSEAGYKAYADFKKARPDLS